MTTLRDLCTDGHTVLVSIHQPRSSVFAMFDDLILMAGARCSAGGCGVEGCGEGCGSCRACAAEWRGVLCVWRVQ